MEINKLAINGGQPICGNIWPSWPKPSIDSEKNLIKVLNSGRWTISGFYNGHDLFEQKFAKKFAQFCDSKFCIPVSSGSSALKTIMEVLKIGPGDEVIIPSITWKACATTVLSLGAWPILADIDEKNLCINPKDVESRITHRTKAILIVHMYSNVADIDSFVQLSKDFNIPIIEDCSQSHGATWRNKKVGSFGHFGAFSFQHSKVLTCGEGGAIVFQDKKYLSPIEQIKNDGRIYDSSVKDIGFMQLKEIGDYLGSNRCMSEFAAGVLLAQLDDLEKYNIIRLKNAEVLDELLSKIEGIKIFNADNRISNRTYYQYCFRIDRSHFNFASIESIGNALSHEVSALIEPLDTPLYFNKLCQPIKSRFFKLFQSQGLWFESLNKDLPNATSVYSDSLTFSHHILLADPMEMIHISNAISKVKELSYTLCN